MHGHDGCADDTSQTMRTQIEILRHRHSPRRSWATLTLVRHGATRLSSKIVLAVLVAVAAMAAATAGATPLAARKIFYLDLRSGQCARGVFTHKTLLLLPCSDPSHNLEIYAVLHGGWKRGHQPSHDTVYARARTLCTGKFRSRFGHPISTPYGWRAFWPDRGTEEAKYGDRLICGLAHYPKPTALGAGTHFR
jgi:hypothetical protein